ncbi:2-amino-4-hydroxy-6-hydroxymethyldihydropteridine diphosphokinase [Algoriphagus halophytocola]|uniref:2-amino-4-hydroxy-6- hydroxymethyldihydropteridine diphosphokinase n=1 Tax=Algoriphagus halophytocola TaxID=2991499 RepID=UPI0022DD2556|nr:2-amino-4-hydroxy-6-hydroxymethyldihydropteridine diphosphokinase [Algoriphagus sp. TR-M9]WBL41984.1 2-amino-4-hydroxy-6-hydroxymethyldihydropteridine diphosphokinase [Algoriphagus sp. TR-M9]
MNTIRPMTENAVLILGGNRGAREELLKAAVEAVGASNTIVKQSKIYETAAWGGVAKGPFLNQVIEIKTKLRAEELLELIQHIEKRLGRKRAEPWGDRTMDIDILFFGKTIIATDLLQVPHPFISQRKFVLIPLAEILPDFMHPVLGKSSQEMLRECEDKSQVKEYER